MEKIINKIENSMIYLMLTLSFLLYSSATENTKFISFIIWPLVFISSVCLLYRMFNLTEYSINSLHKYLFIFVISYTISCVINIAKTLVIAP